MPEADIAVGMPMKTVVEPAAERPAELRICESMIISEFGTNPKNFCKNQ
ncbi:MAG: hypothetical protein MZV70_67390 [Desulfobacterales bacterium]|nr:hypothetical protein [Desulfobacterales bacterium]